MSQVKRDLLDLNQQSRRAVHAPVAGKVTSVQAYSGMAVDLAKPLMTILPQNSNLEANLFVPTRAVGLLAKGQKVLIQYEAFPYQKYGIHEGTIRYISRSVLNPKEISGIDLSHEFEPLYRVVVAINSQTIQAGGAVIPLQAGMSIKADIVLESRTLLEWLFEPFFHFGA
jgi:membrane fusion protein